MELGTFEKYLVTINVLGFIFFAVNTWLYSNTEDKNIDKALTISALMGGSLGIVLSIFIFERKPVKDNMMSRVFISSVFVIQITILLIIKGYGIESLKFSFWTFFADNKILLVYLVVINFVTFVAFIKDKLAALEKKTRIRIIKLLGLSFIGGSLGGLTAMYLFRHKTRKNYFTVGLPLMIVMQLVVVFYLMNITI